jgi:hypothetical protein
VKPRTIVFDVGQCVCIYFKQNNVLQEYIGGVKEKQTTRDEKKKEQNSRDVNKKEGDDRIITT